MAFKFGLEPVLKHRKRLEDAAQREYAEAQAAVDTALNELEQMYNRLDEVRVEIQQAQQSEDHAKIDRIRDMESFVIGQKVRIEAKRQQARQLLMVAEDKQEALILAARERKILLKLKEKRMAEYREALNRMEAKMADDQTTMARAWGKR